MQTQAWLALALGTLLIACAPDQAPTDSAGEVERSLDATEPSEPPAPEDAEAESVVYSVLEEAVSDEPIKTQIEQHIVAKGIPSAQGLEAEIRNRYAAAVSRKGFRYHNPASNIYIYVYGSEEQARAGQGLWIGMLAKGPSDTGEPRVQISQERLAALSAPSEERFGLSEEMRRQVFREITAAEDRATREAMSRVPDSQIMKQIDLERELSSKYKLEVARKYGLSEEQLLKVTVEGVTNGWVL